jgi:histone deacetylase 3
LFYFKVLHPDIPSRIENANSKQYLDSITKHTYDILKMCQHSPSVQMFDIPADSLPDEKDRNLDEPDGDVRMNQSDIDNLIDKNNEFYDDDNDNDKNENDL